MLAGKLHFNFSEFANNLMIMMSTSSMNPSIALFSSQAGSTSGLSKSPLEVPSEPVADGFSELLIASQSVVEERDLLPEDGVAVVPPFLPLLAQDGTSLRPRFAGGDQELPDLSAKQPLVSAIRKLMEPRGVATLEPAHMALAPILSPEPRRAANSSHLSSEPQRAALTSIPPPEAELLSDPKQGAVNSLLEPEALRSSAFKTLIGLEKALPGFHPVSPEPSFMSPAPTPVLMQALSVISTDQLAPRLPSIAVPVGEAGWDKALGERILWMAGDRLQRAEVRLSPPHLGPIDIRISVVDDQASVSFAAQHLLTREAVEAAIPRLREMMQEGNLNLVNVNVEQRESNHQGRPDDSGRGPENQTSYQEADNSSGILQGAENAPTRTSATNLVDDYA